MNDLKEMGKLIDEVDARFVDDPSSFPLEEIEKIESVMNNLGKTIVVASEDYIRFHYFKGNFYSVIYKHAIQNNDGVKAHWLNLTKDEKIDVTVDSIKKSQSEYIICMRNAGTADPILYPVLTNFANNLYREHRIQESIDVISPIVDIFPMARMANARYLYELAITMDNISAKSFVLKKSKREYIRGLKEVDSRNIGSDQREYFENMVVYLDRLVKIRYHDSKRYRATRKKTNDYKEWCSKNALTLSLMNILNLRCVEDDVTIATFAITSFKLEQLYSFVSQFNTIKQEYNISRYFLYQSSIKHDSVHESQKDVVIEITNYEAVGYKTEMLKTSIKAAHGVFDKIAQLCYTLFGTNAKSMKSIKNWISEEKNVSNSYFDVIQWLIDDTRNEESQLSAYDFLRNVLEHRILRVYECYSVPWIEESVNRHKDEYSISIDELESNAYGSVKMARDLILYFANAVNATNEYNHERNQFVVPMIVSKFEDEWKN